MLYFSLCCPDILMTDEHMKALITLWLFVLDYFGFNMFNKLRIVYIWLTINAKPLADTLDSVLVTQMTNYPKSLSL